MNKKQTIQILKHFNGWRRDRNPVNSYEMPDPKKLGIAIDTAIDILESKSKVNESYKKKYEDIQAVLDSSISELQFANLQIQALNGALDEIVSMTNDPLAKKVSEMAKERHMTDKLIHSRLIFGNNMKKEYMPLYTHEQFKKDQESSRKAQPIFDSWGL